MKNITNKCKKEEFRFRQKKINTKKLNDFFFEKSISDRIKTGLCDQNNDLCWFIYTPNYTSFEFVDRYAESLNGSPWWNWRKFVNEARTVFVCVQFWAWVNKSVIAGCRCPVIRLMASNKPILFLGLALSILYQPLPIACFLQRCFFFFCFVSLILCHSPSCSHISWLGVHFGSGYFSSAYPNM